MRFILLRKRNGKTFFDSILKIGCGPNFVLNRSHAFEEMIKQQGVTFWFRFWLLVCFNHCCFHLQTIREYLPDVMSDAFTQLHQQFLQGSDNEAYQYCIGVLKSMRITEKNNLTEKEDKNETHDLDSLKELVTKVLEITFGAALCEIFYKWLSANEMDDKSKRYWSIPDEYLDINFQPGKLERFLVKGWKEKLFTLFDVPENRVPWVAALLEDRILTPRINSQEGFNYSEHARFIKEVTSGMKMYRRDRIKEIYAVDEFPNKRKPPERSALLSTEKITIPCSLEWPYGDAIVSDSEQGVTNNLNSIGNYTGTDPSSAGSDELFFNNNNKRSKSQICCFCGTENDDFTRLVLCQQCVGENENQPKYYCSASCQIEHWFQVHSKDHGPKNSTTAKPVTTHTTCKLESKTDFFKRLTHWNFFSSLVITVMLIFCSPTMLDLCFMVFGYISEKTKLFGDKNYSPRSYFVNNE